MSVVTPVFNLKEAAREAQFQQAVASVREQSYPHVEHIVVDGASTDGTTERLRAMAADGAFDALISKPDEGAYHAMNRGAAQARGELLLFLNSDDYYHDPDGLTRLVRHAARSAADFICSPVVVTDGETRRLAGVSRFFMRTLLTIPAVHQGMAVRRAAFEALEGFDTRYRVVADHDLILRLLFAGYRGSSMTDAFATFREGGISADRDALVAEQAQVLARAYAPYATRSRTDWTEVVSQRMLPRPVMAAVFRDTALPWRVRALVALHALKASLSRR